MYALLEGFYIFLEIFYDSLTNIHIYSYSPVRCHKLVYFLSNSFPSAIKLGGVNESPFFEMINNGNKWYLCNVDAKLCEPTKRSCQRPFVLRKEFLWKLIFKIENDYLQNGTHFAHKCCQLQYCSVYSNGNWRLEANLVQLFIYCTF